MILGPWSATNSDFANMYFQKAHVDDLGLAMLNAIELTHGQDYLYGTGNAGGALYLADGVFPDFTSARGSLGYTFELRTQSGFDPAAWNIYPCGEETLAAVLVAIQWAQEHAPGG